MKIGRVGPELQTVHPPYQANLDASSSFGYFSSSPGE